MAAQTSITFSNSTQPGPPLSIPLSKPPKDVHGSETSTPGREASLILLEAVPAHEGNIATFLRDINNGVNQEPGTDPWLDTRFSKTSFAIS
ncbi:uncharacterized protein A1O5_01504 [Cladophialophora psammophila CBS 110553]|uniref:Uncharacterized protein n=1 Tax=Cladophialophora psammophila CBS 110553 TaxID=1182543 RepID=W9X3N0_9EURO|nr:uncharacterized protein A1O5_01504 [Cladophialophora psammophila CBS 110553]EXJ74808.1 hypothetical protein A1O5_01504 [Cladophialophora psammophila CBS 110553]